MLIYLTLEQQLGGAEMVHTYFIEQGDKHVLYTVNSREDFIEQKDWLRHHSVEHMTLPDFDSSYAIPSAANQYCR